MTASAELTLALDALTGNAPMSVAAKLEARERIEQLFAELEARDVTPAMERRFWDAWDQVELERERITVFHHGPIERAKGRAGLIASLASAQEGTPP